jgi:2-dehydropantoate 2-reductase
VDCRTEENALRMNSAVYVIGAGRVGLFFARAFEEAGLRVRVCLRAAVDKFIVQTPTGNVALGDEPVLAPGHLQPARWVVLATKAQDTPRAGRWLSRLVASGSTLIIAQNGVDHARRGAKLAPGAEIVSALVYAGIERVGPGRARHHSGWRVDVPAGASADALSAPLEGSEIEITKNADLVTGAWRKLLNNIMGNPITALTLRRGEVFRDPAVQVLARAILREAATVAQAEGARLNEKDIEDVTAFHARIPSDGGTSMLYDRLAGRSLEHQYLTGDVGEAAKGIQDSTLKTTDERKCS